VKHHEGSLLKAGSVSDHIHLLILHPRTCAPAKLVQEIKTGSSKWLKTTDRKQGSFYWQNGYGMFSVSPSHRAPVEMYLENQAEHHRKVGFQEEYRQLLQKYGIQYNESYVWD
jgi:REP element-mobilizing transposase RayT